MRTLDVAARIRQLFTEGEFDDCSELKASRIEEWDKFRVSLASVFTATIDGQKFDIIVTAHEE